MMKIYDERNKMLFVLKSRGMPHSNQVREFLFTPRGIELVDVYQRGEAVLTGSARAAQEAADRAADQARSWEIERRKRQLEHQRQVMERQVAELRAKFETEAAALQSEIEEHEQMDRAVRTERDEVSRRRGGS